MGRLIPLFCLFHVAVNHVKVMKAHVDGSVPPPLVVWFAAEWKNEKHVKYITVKVMSFTQGEVTADNVAGTQNALSEVRNMRMTDQLFAASGGVQLAQHLQQGRISTASSSTQPANEVTLCKIH